MSSAQVVQSNSLTDLAARIRAEHENSILAVKRGLAHAISAGQLLIEAKAQLQHGQWLPWLRDHCQVPERTAQLYMKLATHGDEIRSVADLTVRGAMAALMPPNEGEAILRRIAEADAQLAEAAEEEWRDCAALRCGFMTKAQATATPSWQPSPHMKRA